MQLALSVLHKLTQNGIVESVLFVLPCKPNDCFNKMTALMWYKEISNFYLCIHGSTLERIQSPIKLPRP